MISTVKSNKETPQIKTHSLKTIVSYNFGQFASDFQGAFTGLYFFFYETEVLLGVWFITIANIIYAIWNAIDDPMMGYLTDRPTRFTKKWGKRFPWILTTGISVFFIYILLFLPPDVDPNDGAWILFFWLLIFLCISDALYSTYHVNFYGMFPDKFRTDKERSRSAGIGTAITQVGLVLGMLLPPLLYKFGDKGSYGFMAVICALIGILAVIATIPGVKEDKEMIERYLQSVEGKKKESFFTILKIAMTEKNFILYVVIYFVFQVLVVLATTSIPYFVKYILGLEANVQLILNIGLLIGLLGSVPFWVRLSKKIGFGKTFIVAGIAMGALTSPLLFASDLLGGFISTILIGAGIGGFWVMLLPVFSDVMDEIAIKTGKRQEGVFLGIRTFFARFAIIIQTVVFAIIHTLTNFLPYAPTGTDTQPPLAILGIRIHMALIPMIFVFIGVILFWLFYDITEQKKTEIKNRLKELNL